MSTVDSSSRRPSSSSSPTESESRMGTSKDEVSHEGSINGKNEETHLVSSEERQRQLELRIGELLRALEEQKLKARARSEEMDGDGNPLKVDDDNFNNKKTVKAELFSAAPGTIAPALEGHTAVLSSGRVIVFGGTKANDKGVSYPQSDVHVFTIANRRWKRVDTVGDIPSGRHGHASVLIRDKAMLVFGGYGADGLTATMYMLDLATFRWTELPPSSEDGDIVPIKGHSLVVYKSKLYLFGGCTRRGRINTVRCFDLSAKKWLSQEPYNQQTKEQDEALREGESRRKEVSDVRSPPGHADEDAACDIKRKKLIESDYVEKKKETLRLAANIPKPRSGHTSIAFPYKNSFVVFGGRLGKLVFSNDTFIYDIGTLRWEKLYCSGEVPSVRCDHVSVILNGCMYVFGGYAITASGKKVFYNDLYCLNLLTQVWSKVEIEPHRRDAVPPVGCSRGGLLFENPSGNICLLMHGGWVANIHKHRRRDPSHYVTTLGHSDEVWVLDFGVKCMSLYQKKKESPPSFLTRYPIIKQQVEVCDNQLESERRNTLNENGNPKPIHTSKFVPGKPQRDSMQQEFNYSSPKRSQEEVDKIVSRLYDTRARDMHMAALEKKYLFTRKQTEVSLEEQEDSVLRLYEEAEIRQAKLKELDRKFYPSPPPKDVDETDIYESVIRLSKLPPCRQLPVDPDGSHTSSRLKK